MKLLAATALAIALGAIGVPETAAHRLDECLVATRIEAGRDKAVIKIDLVPGSALFPEFMAWVDRDADGQIGQEEADGYAQKLLSDCVLTADNKPVALSLVAVSLPPMGGLATGAGRFRITARSTFPQLSPGSHTLVFRCCHHPEACVYLANALAPRDPQVKVLRQERDALQTELAIHLDIVAEADGP
jgi:hypothetical protein